MIEVPTSPNYAYEGVSAGHGPCIVCGRDVTTPAPAMVHLHGGGASVVTEEEAAGMDSSEDMGLQPVGSGCLRKHPELKPYVQ